MTKRKVSKIKHSKSDVSAAEACPDIYEWWDFKKNNNVDPATLSCGIKKKFYFTCPECHTTMYRDMQRFIIKNKDGTFSHVNCQKCHPTQCKTKVNLVDAVPDIEKYWDYELNKGKKPSEFGASSSEKVWTKCPICGTSVKRNIRYTWEKDENGVGKVIHCRTCGKRSKKNSLVNLFPEIKKYWAYDKNKHDPEYYAISSGKKVYIRCPFCGYERYGAIGDLIVKDGEKYRITICPNCKNPKRIIKKAPSKRRFTSIAKACPDIYKYWDDSKNPEDIPFSDKTIKIKIKCPSCGKSVERYVASNIKKDKETGVYTVKICQKCAVKEANTKLALERNKPLIEECPEFEKWWDYEKNTVDIKTITRGSHTKVHLKCPACGKELVRDPHSFVAFNRAGELLPVSCPECGYNTKGDPEENLLKLCPSIVNWWDYEANYPFRPEQFTPGSTFKVHLKCPDCGIDLYTGIHSLVATDKNGKVYVRHEGRCRKFKAMDSENNLVKKYPEVIDWWDYEANDGERPEEYTLFSDKKAHFVCPKCGGKYYLRITDAFSLSDDGIPKLFKCSYCNNIRALSGFNTLADIKPGLVSEWSSNNELKANEVLPESYNRALWICPTCGGEYSALIRDREVGNDACPYCKNIRPLVGYNTLADKKPELISEWSPNNESKPDEVVATLSLPALWICPTCHGEYSTPIRDREAGDDSCPYCNNRKPLVGYNTLADKKPELVSEWSPNNQSKPNEVVATSTLPALWICPTCHGEYSTPIRNREFGDDSCPYCNNRKPLVGYNTLVDKKPELVSEWSPNNENKPDEVVAASTLPALWICPTCHGEYSASIRDREAGDDACPYCNNRKPLVGYNTLADKKPNLIAEWSPNNENKPDEVVATSTLPALWICPTCHGEYSASIRDREVGDDSCPYCNNRKPLVGYNTLADKKPNLIAEWSPNNQIKPDEVVATSSLPALWICPTCHGEYSASIRDREVGDDSCPYCNNRKPLVGYNTLADKKPNLIAEWSPNNQIKPDEVVATSSLPALWICPTCHGEYSASIRDRESGDDACPYCRNKKPLPGFNTLQARHPELVKQEWCYAENLLLGVNPDNILESYSGKVWWKCPTCGRKYIMTVKDRLMKQKRGHVACQQCRGRRWIRSFNI